MKVVKTTPTGRELVEGIISKKINMPHIEMELAVRDTLDKPIVRKVFKEDTSLGFTFVTAMVKRFVDSFGFSNKINETQIELITVDAIDNFKYETVEDIILFFKMARSGRLGVTNRGLDSNLIFGEWFPKYMELKATAREEAYQRKKSELNSIEVSHEDVMATYQKHAERKKPTMEKRVKDYVDKITKDFDRQMLEDLILDWKKDEEKKKYIRILKEKRRTIKQ